MNNERTPKVLFRREIALFLYHYLATIAIENKKLVKIRV